MFVGLSEVCSLVSEMKERKKNNLRSAGIFKARLKREEVDEVDDHIILTRSYTPGKR